MQFIETTLKQIIMTMSRNVDEDDEKKAKEMMIITMPNFLLIISKEMKKYLSSTLKLKH